MALMVYFPFMIYLHVQLLSIGTHKNIVSHSNSFKSMLMYLSSFVFRHLLRY